MDKSSEQIKQNVEVDKSIENLDVDISDDENSNRDKLNSNKKTPDRHTKGQSEGKSIRDSDDLEIRIKNKKGKNEVTDVEGNNSKKEPIKVNDGDKALGILGLHNKNTVEEAHGKGKL